MGWLLLRQREWLVAARNELPVPVAGSRRHHQSSRLRSAWERRLSLAFFPLSYILCGVRNDGLLTSFLPPRSSPVAVAVSVPVPGCSALYGPRLVWSTLFLRPQTTLHADYCVEVERAIRLLLSLFFVVGEHGEQLAVGNRREFFLCLSRVSAPSIDSLLLLVV